MFRSAFDQVFRNREENDKNEGNGQNKKTDDVVMLMI